MNAARYIQEELHPLFSALLEIAPSSSESQHRLITLGCCHERNSSCVERNWSAQYCRRADPRWALAPRHAREPGNTSHCHGVGQRVLRPRIALD